MKQLLKFIRLVMIPVLVCLLFFSCSMEKQYEKYLKKHPELNATNTKDSIRWHDSTHITEKTVNNITRADTNSIMALVKCNDSGAQLAPITIRAGKKKMQVGVKNGVITATLIGETDTSSNTSKEVYKEKDHTENKDKSTVTTNTIHEKFKFMNYIWAFLIGLVIGTVATIFLMIKIR